MEKLKKIYSKIEMILIIIGIAFGVYIAKRYLIVFIANLLN